jgi:peptidoglycan/xylan/chitin deacetylase (PgdA/CDA1 family)
VARTIKPASALVFGAATIAVIAISTVLTLRARAAPAATPKRFSGSSVVLRMPSLLSGRRLPARLRVAIVRDDAAVGYYDSPRTLDTIVARWRDELTAVGASARVVRPSQLRGLSTEVVVVPSSPCLTIETREAIEAAGARGQGLIVTGMAGVSDAGCRAIGYGLVIGLTGASRAEVLRDRPMVYVSIPGDGPLSADIPPGARLNISPGSQVALRAPARDAFYSDYALGALPPRGEPFLDAAVVRSSYRGARVVYFGFELSQAVRSEWNRGVLRMLVRNAAAWAGSVPMAAPRSWPAGYVAAAVLAQDVEQNFENASLALDSLRVAGIRSTYFVTSDLALRNRRLTRRMAAAGEIGTHSENHTLLGGAPYAEQLERLQTTQLDLAQLLETPVRGLRPPEEQFDEATMAAWLDAGGTYLLGANDSRCAAPELLRIRRDTLLLVPRVFADDFAAAGAQHRNSPATIAALMRRDFARARSLSGLYVLSYHSQLLARAEYVPTLASVARHIAADSSVWLTTADEIAEWWLARSQLDIRVARPSSNQIEVIVRNPSRQVIERTGIQLTLPHGKRIHAASVPHAMISEGMARLTVRFLSGASTLRISVALGS